MYILCVYIIYMYIYISLFIYVCIYVYIFIYTVMCHMTLFLSTANHMDNSGCKRLQHQVRL